MRFSPASLTVGAATLALFVIVAGAAPDAPQPAAPASILLRYDTSAAIAFRRRLDRDITMTHAIAGDTREQRDASRITVEYSVAPHTPQKNEKAPPAIDGAATLAYRLNSLSFIASPADPEAVETFVTRDGIEIRQHGKKLRASKLKGSPYHGIASWRALRQIRGDFTVAAEFVDEHALFADLFRSALATALTLPAREIRPGDAWQCELPVWILDAEDRLDQTGLRLRLDCSLAAIEPLPGGDWAARIAFTGDAREPAVMPQVKDSATVLRYTAFRQHVSGFVLWDLRHGMPLKTELTIEFDFQHEKTLAGEATAYAATRRMGTLKVLELQIREEPKTDETGKETKK